ncbi:MAG: hypothetical protein JXA33_23375 [Anaerolineae bacterium]|nr:hypothetical protein [Anaerolineae bacterium]
MIVYTSEILIHEQTEYFLLASYGCLPNVIKRLEILQDQQQRAVLFCFSQSLYQFLYPLSKHYTWIKLHYVDITPITRIHLRNPYNWWCARRRVRELYEQWFSNISNEAVIHFYNRHEALFLFYVVTQLKTSHTIHYVECDPVDLYRWDYRSIQGWIQWCIFRLIYPVPFYMANLREGKSKRISVLSSRFINKTVSTEYPKVVNLSVVKNSPIYQTLSWHSEIKVLWIMGLVLDMEQVIIDDYNVTLKKCSEIFDHVCPAHEQAIKFHPRAQKHEAVWGTGVQYIPNHIPVEFLDLPNLQAIVVISSAAVSTFRSSGSVKIISLVNILPFVNASVHKKHQMVIRHLMPEERLCLPASMDDLRTYINDHFQIYAR